MSSNTQEAKKLSNLSRKGKKRKEKKRSLQINKLVGKEAKIKWR